MQIPGDCKNECYRGHLTAVCCNISYTVLMTCCFIRDCCHRQKYQSGDKGNEKTENMWLLTQIPSFLKKPPKEKTEEVAWKGQNTDYKSVEGDESVCFLRESPFRILRAAENGNVKEFQRILSGDPAKLVVYDGRGRIPVHQAAAKNRKEILKIIVEYGGDLNLKDNAGNTPLHLATDKEAVDAIEFLLQNNVDCRVLRRGRIRIFSSRLLNAVV